MVIFTACRIADTSKVKKKPPSHKLFFVCLFVFRNIKLQKVFLEKEMATHSSILAWRILGTEEPGGLPSMGSHRVRHDWSDLAAAAAAERVSGAYDGKESACYAGDEGDLGLIPGSEREGIFLQRKTLWRREWQPTQVFFPGEVYGQKNLEG